MRNRKFGPLAAALLVIPGVSTVTSAAPPAALSVDVKEFTFAPKQITVRAGQSITWVNDDEEPHTIVFDKDATRSPVLDKGERYTHTFAAAGTFSYHCSLHPHMIGTVVVEPSAS